MRLCCALTWINFEHDLEVLLFLNVFKLEAIGISSLEGLMTGLTYRVVWLVAGVPKPEGASESFGQPVVTQDAWPTRSDSLGLRTTLREPPACGMWGKQTLVASIDGCCSLLFCFVVSSEAKLVYNIAFSFRCKT